MRTELAYVVGEHGRGVPLRVYRHQQHPDVVSAAAHRLKHPAKESQREWAYVRAVGEAKKEQNRLAAKPGQADSFSGVIRQVEADCRRCIRISRSMKPGLPELAACGE